MHFLYILYSPTADTYYTGETNNVPARLKLHNKPQFLKAITKAASDWKLELIFNCRTKEEAIYLEKYIKRRNNRKFTQSVIEDPGVLEDILKDR